MAKKKGDKLYCEVSQYPNQVIELTIPFPPSQNHMYFTAKNGMRILRTEAKKVFNIIRQKSIDAVREQGWKRELEGIWYRVEMKFYMPDKRKRDSHNTFKIMFDAMEDVIYPDDYYILPTVKSVDIDRNNPRVEIKIFPEQKEV